MLSLFFSLSIPAVAQIRGHTAASPSPVPTTYRTARAFIFIAGRLEQPFRSVVDLASNRACPRYYTGALGSCLVLVMIYCCRSCFSAWELCSLHATVVLRRAIVIKTRLTGKDLYTPVFLRNLFGPDYFRPPPRDSSIRFLG